MTDAEIEISACPRCGCTSTHLLWVHGYWTVVCDRCWYTGEYRSTKILAAESWNWRSK